MDSLKSKYFLSEIKRLSYARFICAVIVVFLFSIVPVNFSFAEDDCDEDVEKIRKNMSEIMADSESSLDYGEKYGMRSAYTLAYAAYKMPIIVGKSLWLIKKIESLPKKCEAMLADDFAKWDAKFEELKRRADKLTMSASPQVSSPTMLY